MEQYYYKNIPVDYLSDLPDGDCVIELISSSYTDDDLYDSKKSFKFVVPSKELTTELINFDYETQKAIEKLENIKETCQKLEREYHRVEEVHNRKLATLIDTNNRMQKSFETLCTLTKQQQDKYDMLTKKISDLQGE